MRNSNKHTTNENLHSLLKLLFNSVSIACVCLFLLECDIEPTSEPINESELPGKYIANFKGGLEEYIILNADHYYIHYFKSKSATEYTDTGHWKFYNELGDSTSPRIRFDDFIFRYPILINCYDNSDNAVLDTTPSVWGTYLYKSSGHIAIKLCPRMRQYYFKK